MGAYNDNILLIHIPKCAGWTVKNYMREHLPGVLMPDQKESGLPIGHVRLQDIPRFTGRPVESFELIVAPIRNPAAQQVSQATFWATRHLTGSRHFHDVSAWRHVSEDLVREDIMRCSMTPEVFEWRPHHINMAGFAQDPRCDFRTWYNEHYGGEMNGDGYYRYWLTYNGKIPDSVRLVDVTYLHEDLPKLLQPFADGRPLPTPPRLNTSPHQVAEDDWIPKAAQPTLQRTFSWYFAEGKDRLWRPE